MSKEAEQFFYGVEFTKGGRVQVTADSYEIHDAPNRDNWLVFQNRGEEIFRYRTSLLAGWWRVAKPGVTA